MSDKLVEIVEQALCAGMTDINTDDGYYFLAPEARHTFAVNIVQAVEEERLNRPKIICLCGSSRFIESFAVLSWEFEKAGNICLGLHYLPESYCRGNIPDHLAEYEGVARKMDELHLRKIDLADEVFVINVNGYIGESTSREIDYAIHHNKEIIYLEPPTPSGKDTKEEG